MSEIDVTLADRVATVTINRPGQRNAMTLAMWRGMAALFGRLSADPEVRAIILTGAGEDFSTGADIAEFGLVRGDAGQAEAYEVAVDACSAAIEAAAKPTLAALRGYCLGGGNHLAMACDFRVADPSARIGIPAARLSIVYGVRSTQRLLALVGLPAAKRLLFTAERIDAAEGLRLGFLDRVGPDALAEARRLAAAMADNAPLSIAGAKAILNGLAMGPGALDPALAEGLIAQAADSHDYREGRAAFADKRKPAFRGC
ncbi:Short-chain-enoyl-CoA hydratase [Methylobacterium crusticola]|uniref:Short-chain-enoyl-CoA hydratase n=2 Tax=Methylobacterium crusticola TaxID=1697972 RepID=A0ABQ4R8Q4_9HYPH|nr:enoyl-CoA hydratase-related protein [Methylobacterium crusticola]GJD53151.1 Short-chain-enoyl-CoA hydratase [Methylobacterium crusticola]